MAEQRLIDANNLIEEIREERCYNCRNFKDMKCDYCGTADYIYMIEDMPAADVAQVRHGYWRPILHKDGKTDYECSCCLGIIMDVPDDDEHDLCAWCSMCGAKMDLEG